MKEYVVKSKSTGKEVVAPFPDKRNAAEYVADNLKYILKDTANFKDVFDIICEERKAIIYPLTYKDACKILEIDEGTIVMESNEGDRIGSDVVVSKSCVGLVKSAVAFYKLCIIAKAWNKIDGFVPDFSNVDQSRYTPWFKYDSDAAGFVYAGTHYTASITGACIGSPLCFGSPETAEEFGKMFNGLYNKMFQ